MSHELLIYTFRTFPWQEELRTLGYRLFIFGSLKKDLPPFLEMASARPKSTILGIAAWRKKYSQLEGKAVNKFNVGKISKDGEDYYCLSTMSITNFRINYRPYTSFCNWTSYKVQQQLNPKHHYFGHVGSLIDVQTLLEQINP